MSDAELVDRASDLVPLLKKDAAETERLGHLVEENTQALRDAGLST